MYTWQRAILEVRSRKTAKSPTSAVLVLGKEVLCAGCERLCFNTWDRLNILHRWILVNLFTVVLKRFRSFVTSSLTLTTAHQLRQYTSAKWN
ncbi:hypothetical protein RvY_13332 [Ramazzottius varieornatus]|uniref:Uncharacterized protein n=1 Tax=Ramazzottius varieornatus TaxID=947166 RepID=A0A1D1VMH1_RAMVA|nr:hypothetical protein RvY_13332 [Ramazzottius varieornatus]